MFMETVTIINCIVTQTYADEDSVEYEAEGGGLVVSARSYHDALRKLETRLTRRLGHPVCAKDVYEQ